jgi:hypothetical protein
MTDTVASDVLRGVGAISQEVGLTKREAYYKLEKGIIPAGKDGSQWVASRKKLREHYATPCIDQRHTGVAASSARGCHGDGPGCRERACCHRPGPLRESGGIGDPGRSSMSINGGRFAVSRDVFEHHLFKKEPFTECQAWIWLVGQAAWKPRRVRATSGRSVQIVDLDRGQLCLALRFIRDAWRWQSEKRVRTFLRRLETDAMIAVQTDTLQNVITVCNYDAYQFATAEPDAHSDAQADAQETHTGRKLKKDNKSKNDKKRKEVYTLGFDEWYAVYPRKKQPSDARKAYAQIIASGTVTEAELLIRTKAFATWWQARPVDEHRYIPYPASWLNKAGFADELDRPPVSQSRTKVGRPISPEIAARREHFGLQPARPGSVADAGELMLCELQERERAGRASAARVVGSSSSADSGTANQPEPSSPGNEWTRPARLVADATQQADALFGPASWSRPSLA